MWISLLFTRHIDLFVSTDIIWIFVIELYVAYLSHLLWAATLRALLASPLIWALRWSCLSNFFPHTPHTRRQLFLCSSLSCFVLKVSSHQGRVQTRHSSLSLCFLSMRITTCRMICFVMTEHAGQLYNIFIFNIIHSVTVSRFNPLIPSWFIYNPTLYVLYCLYLLHNY